MSWMAPSSRGHGCSVLRARFAVETEITIFGNVHSMIFVGSDLLNQGLVRLHAPQEAVQVFCDAEMCVCTYVSSTHTYSGKYCT